MPFKQCLVLPTIFPESNPRDEQLAEIKSYGVKGIEIWSREEGYEELFTQIKNAGLNLVSMVGHEHECPKAGSHAEGFSRRKNHERLEAELKASIDIAAEWGMPGIITLSGHRNEGESDEEGLDVCAEGLRRIAPYAEEKGINLNMELLNTTVDHPNYLCDHSDWAIRLCEKVNSPRVKILYDIYHMQIMEGNLCSNIKRASKWIGHYHTAGVPGRHELDDLQEIHYPAVCKAINETGYELYLGHEFFAKGDLLAGLKQAVQFCDLS